MDPIIKLENVSLWYNKDKPIEVQALKNVSLEIERGDYAAFFGPSGCGKTTMLYAISGIDRFQEGKIIINDREISNLSNQELAIFRQTGIGIVFQQFNLVPSLTVLKNVALPMLFVGVTSEKADQEAKKLLERLNLMEYADRYPFELSGGQQQRVGIARAIANDPPIIVADEPLGNLDSVNAKNVLEFLKELNEKDGRTIIMVTHEAWSLRDAKTIFHMKDGVMTEVEHPSGNLASSLTEHLNKQISSVSGVEDKKETEKNSIGGKEKGSGSEEKGKEGGGTGEEKKIEGVGTEKLSAHVIANFLLRGYSLDEINRFETFVNKLFTKEIDIEEFHKLINKSYKEEGVGLWKKKAERIVEYLNGLIEERKNIEDIYKSIESNVEVSIFDEVKNIRDWLVEGYTGELSPMQIGALDQVISDRIRNLINHDDTVKVLSLSNKKFGVGLSLRAAHLIAEKLELILNEGDSNKEKK